MFSALKPQWSYFIFFAYCYTCPVLFLALSQSTENVSICIVDALFFLFCFCHNGSKQGKEAWKCIYIAFAILGETEGLFSEWMRLKDLRGKLPAAKAVCGQIKTLVIAGNLLLRVTHNPLRSRQEAAAEYFLFLPPCRRQTGATFLNQRRLGVED